jgi:hypothetical protein
MIGRGRWRNFPNVACAPGRREEIVTAWLVMTTDDPVLLGAGYDDDAGRYYSWDNTVPLHASLRPGDSIVLWDKHFLLGVSVIDTIERGRAEKIRYRCPVCHKTKMQTRKRKKPPYWCPECKQGVTDPVEELIEVETYRSHHEASWVDLSGQLDGSQLRLLCYKPKSQHAIRELDWSRFTRELAEDLRQPVARIASPSSRQIPGGHKPRLVKVRRGQGAFRRQLTKRYGETCALSGPAPSHVLDAAHLYSYAEVGKHDDLGGLLIRKDLHRLFDLGLILVEPSSLTIHVSDSLASYPDYQSLQGKKLSVDLMSKTKKWIKRHWDFHNRRPNTELEQ